MTRQAVGFYWTLPVPWAHFTQLPADIDAAARASKTIRYQRELIRRYAADENLRLIHEEVFLEIAPDRGSPLIQEPLGRAERICKANDAVLLFVDFAAVGLSRRHEPLMVWMENSAVETQAVYPTSIETSGFDPHRHFADWRKLQHEWTASKPERARAARDMARQLLDQGLAFKEVAERLNAQGLRSPSNKDWTADNLGKFMKSV